MNYKPEIEIFNFLAISSNLLSFLDQSPVTISYSMGYQSAVHCAIGYGRWGIDLPELLAFGFDDILKEEKEEEIL